MRFIPLVIMLALSTFILLGSCTRDSEEQSAITVFCGSANKPAMQEIASLFEAERGIKVNLIYGGSGTLLSQVELSKSGEIYLPGSPDYIIKAERRKQIVPGSDRIVAYLIPAIVTPKGNPAKIESLEDLARPGVKIGLGNPETVCLGLYGVELFEANHLLDEVLENVVTFGASCSKSANLVAMNHVDAILGWRVFQFWNPERMEAVLFKPDEVPRISYIPISIPVYTRDRSLSEAFIEFTLSDKGKAAYEKYGYITDREEAQRFAPDATVGGEYALPDDYFDRIKRLWEKK